MGGVPFQRVIKIIKGHASSSTGWLIWKIARKLPANKDSNNCMPVCDVFPPRFPIRLHAKWYPPTHKWQKGCACVCGEDLISPIWQLLNQQLGTQNWEPRTGEPRTSATQLPWHSMLIPLCSRCLNHFRRLISMATATSQSTIVTHCHPHPFLIHDASIDFAKPPSGLLARSRQVGRKRHGQRQLLYVRIGLTGRPDTWPAVKSFWSGLVCGDRMQLANKCGSRRSISHGGTSTSARTWIAFVG